MARTNVKSDPQFQTLLAVLGSEDKARAAFDRINGEKVDPQVQKLIDAGFTKADAEKALAGESEAKPEAKKPTTSKERAEALVEKRGFSYAKGRVYATTALAEAIVRVHKGGKAEIVASSGVGRTKAVLVYREESGDVALQNLTKGE